MKLRKQVLSLLLATSILVSSVQITSFALDDKQTVTLESINDMKVIEETPEDSNLQGVADSTLQEEISSNNETEDLQEEISSENVPEEEIPNEDKPEMAAEDGNEDSEGELEDGEKEPPAIRVYGGLLSSERTPTSISLYGITNEWIESITGVELDGTLLDKEQYQIGDVRSDFVTLTFSNELFQRQTSREQQYTITIYADGYKSVTTDFTMTSYAANSFTIRVLDTNGSVVKSVEFTLEQMQEMATEQNYIKNYASPYCTYIRDYKVSGVTLDTLFQKADIKVGNGQVLWFRTNYAKEVNDDVDSTDYEDWLTYEECTAKRYTFTNIYESEEWLEKISQNSQNIATLKEILWGASKQEVEPMISIQYGYQDLKPGADPANVKIDKSTEKFNTFGFFMGIEIDENADASSISFRETIDGEIYGIDIVESTEPILKDKTVNAQWACTLEMEKVDQSWLNSITAVYLDDQQLDNSQYSFYDRYGRLMMAYRIHTSELRISSSLFEDQPVRRQTYEIRVVADGYEDVTADLTIVQLKTNNFTIRIVNENGNVKKTKTFTRDELISWSQETEQPYIVASEWWMSEYKITGLSLRTLLEKVGVSFKEEQVLKLRTNGVGWNLPNDAEAYEATFTYEELMKSRYTFTDLNDILEHLNYWDYWLNQCEKIEVEPILALKYGEMRINENWVPGKVDYNSYTEESAFTFFVGVEFEDDGYGNVWANENYSYIIDQIFGIDIVDNRPYFTLTPVVKDSYVYDGKAVEVSCEVKDSQGNVITDTNGYGLKLQSYYREASTEQWIAGLPVNVGTYEVQYQVVSYDSTEEIVFTSETSIVNIQKKTVTEDDKTDEDQPEDDKSEVDKPGVNQPEEDKSTADDALVPTTGTTVDGKFTIASVTTKQRNEAVIAANELIANKMDQVLADLAEKLTSAEQREAYAQLQAALADDTKQVTPDLLTIVDLTATDAEVDEDGNYWVTLSNDKIKADAMIVVLHYKEKEWETIVPEEVLEDKIIFKTSSFSPFAVIELTAADVAGLENPAKNPSDSNGVPTGDDTSKVQIAIWLMLVLSAGTAAVVTRRKCRVE
jgi:hypothetical protein